MHLNAVNSTQPAELFVIDAYDKSRMWMLISLAKMKRYHEKNNKQFVQQPVLVSQVCAYRLVTFFTMTDTRGQSRQWWQEERGKEHKEHTPGPEQEWCGGETAYKH